MTRIEEPTAADRIRAEIDNPTTRERLLSTAIRLLGNEADAEDCVQDALTQASRHAEQFEGRSSPTSWLFRVVINACRMRRRAQRRERRGGGAVHVALDDVTSITLVAAPASDPELTVSGRQTLRLLLDELAQVPETDARLFRRHVLEDVPLASLAAQNKLTRQAVKSRLFRVRRRLSTALSEAESLASA